MNNVSRSVIAGAAALTASLALAASAGAVPLTAGKPVVAESAATRIDYRGGHSGGGPRFSGGGPRFYGGGPRFYGGGFRYGFYAPTPYYVTPSGCGWLRVRALDTGSRYWWHRYHECLEG